MLLHTATVPGQGSAWVRPLGHGGLGEWQAALSCAAQTPCPWTDYIVLFLLLEFGCSASNNLVGGDSEG